MNAVHWFGCSEVLGVHEHVELDIGCRAQSERPGGELARSVVSWRCLCRGSGRGRAPFDAFAFVLCVFEPRDEAFVLVAEFSAHEGGFADHHDVLWVRVDLLGFQTVESMEN